MHAAKAASEAVTALVLLASTSEPHRIGEALLLFAEDVGVRREFGRMGPDHSQRHLSLYRDRPTGRRETGAVRGRHISRTQLQLRLHKDGGVDVRNVGRCTMRINGEPAERGRLNTGDLLEIEGRLLFTVVRRAGWPPYWARAQLDDHPFGRADRHGIVGESEAAWRLRARLATAARGPEAVLLVGPKGAGRHAAAQALLAMSPRTGPLVPIRPARLRVVALERALASAPGGAILIEEVAAVPEETLPALIEAIRKGASTAHRLDERGRAPRVLAATRFKLEAVPKELQRAFRYRIPVAPLSRRCEDIPLVARHIAQLRTPGLQWRPSLEATAALMETGCQAGARREALLDAINAAVEGQAGSSGEVEVERYAALTIPPDE